MPVVAEGGPHAAAVACGSSTTLGAAVAVLEAGGTAVDAAIAGAFAAAVGEPTLSSLGGGGFLLVQEPGDDPVVWDFFVDVPGLGAGTREPHVETLSVTFASGVEQVFHAGWGSVATPGCLSGYLGALARWGRLPLSDVLAPAIKAARGGVLLDDIQVSFIHVIGAILRLTPESAALYDPVLAGEPFRNEAYADLLTALADGATGGATDPRFIEPIDIAMRENGGLVTREDLLTYRPRERTPISLRRCDARIWTNPAPSFGGGIVLDALAQTPADADPATLWPRLLTSLRKATTDRRRRDLEAGDSQVIRGTTHISVIDAEGRVAALSMSNGSGSGVVVEGISFNNMLGEEDLNPHGPHGNHGLAPGTRMGSMMAPSLAVSDDGSLLVAGTGGSERIRSALATVFARVLDLQMPPTAAIGAPRLHAAAELNDVEPGLSPEVLAALRDLDIAVREWPSADLFFGGVHAVRRTANGTVEAIGDSRRGGAVAVVD